MRAEWEKLPLYNKAIDISELVVHITKAIEQTDFDFGSETQSELFSISLEGMQQHALILPMKVARTISYDTIYDLRMENAAIIRRAARELIIDARGLEMHGYKDEEYLDLLRQEVEEFRILFAEWVKTFDPWNYIIDRWGLFNPPGVNYDDHDPDDDISLDSEDFD